MVEETKELKKPDEEIQVDSPEAAVAEEEKKPEEKYEETPEDVEKSRAFHQKQAQEKDEQLKSAQTELDQIYADIDAADPASRQAAPKPPEPIPEKTTPTPAPESVPVDELGQPDVAAIVRQEIRQEVSKLRDDITLDFQQKQEKRDQEQIQRDYDAEKGRCLKGVRKHQRAFNIPDDVFDTCDVEASAVIGNPYFLGAPTRWAKVMRRLFDQHQLQSSITRKATTAEANAAAQVDHAGKVAQPVGSAISPPEARSQEEWNRKQADDIVEDDPSVG